MLGQSTAAASATIDELRAKITQLSKTYNAQHPEVIATRERLAQAEAELARSQAELAKLDAQNKAVRAAQELSRANGESFYAVEAKIRAARERAEAERKLSQTLEKPSVLPPLPETWWRNEAAAKALGLSSTQIKRMDEVFQQSRLKLIDQKAALDKEEAILEPLVEQEAIDESKAAAQLDRVAQARAELEKTRGRMLLGIRKQLDMEQWRKLKETRAIVEKMTLR
jgi:hypothetical protein